MKNRFLILSLMLMLIPVMAWAEVVTEADARQQAMSFLAQRGKSIREASALRIAQRGRRVKGAKAADRKSTRLNSSH